MKEVDEALLKDLAQDLLDTYLYEASLITTAEDKKFLTILMKAIKDRH